MRTLQILQLQLQVKYLVYELLFDFCDLLLEVRFELARDAG